MYIQELWFKCSLFQLSTDSMHRTDRNSRNSMLDWNYNMK